VCKSTRFDDCLNVFVFNLKTVKSCIYRYKGNLVVPVVSPCAVHYATFLRGIRDVERDFLKPMSLTSLVQGQIVKNILFCNEGRKIVHQRIVCILWPAFLCVSTRSDSRDVIFVSYNEA
jgi:hypothetical protein